MTAPESPRQSRRRKKTSGAIKALIEVTPEIDPSIEQTVGVSVRDLSAILLLRSVRGLGPQVFRAIHDLGHRAIDVVENPAILPTAGRRGDSIREQLRNTSADINQHEDRAKRYIAAADLNRSQIITYDHDAYPGSVMRSNYPVPLMFARGSIPTLNPTRSVACVGSREIRSPYSDRQDEFARFAVGAGYSIVSGFALGADTIAHRAAVEADGSTICVMPGGLDRPFPPENRAFWNQLLDYPGAVFVSEAPFGTLTSSLLLRKRNKLIVSFAQGVLVGQSTSQGGAMNAYRFALEQQKPVATFDPDGTEQTTGNRDMSNASPAPATGFPNDKRDEGAWLQWLHELYSSI